MKKIINLTLIAIAFLVVACHKDAALTYMEPVSFTSALKSSATDVTLSATTDSTSVLTLNWPAVVYPVKASVTYTLQVDVPSDTTSATPWSNATNVIVGKDILTKIIKGADLNTWATTLGIAENAKGVLVFRVQAYQDRNAYSSSVTVNVTTYKPLPPPGHGYPVLYVPGDYQTWAPATAPTIAAEKTGIYDGYINEPAGGTYHFKFTSAPDWNHVNYGDGGGAGKLSTDGLAGDLVLPGPGYYELSANTTTNTWTYTLTTWSILGDATPGGWTTDTQMSYDATKQVWTVTANMVSAGSFKFRANNAWIIDFGIDASGKLAYADSPVYNYNAAVANITVPTNGSYTITLDLHDPNNYNYTLHKN